MQFYVFDPCFKDGIEKLSCTERPTNTLFVLIFSWEVLPIIKTQNKCRPSTGGKQACIFNYHLLRILQDRHKNKHLNNECTDQYPAQLWC